MTSEVVLVAELERGDGWIRHAARDPSLERACEVIVVDVTHPRGAELLARARRLAGSPATWTQTIVRIDVPDVDHKWIVTSAHGGVPLGDALDTAPLPRAFGALDAVLASLATPRLVPYRLARATLADRRVTIPCVDVLATAPPGALRDDLCALLARLDQRRDVPERTHAVLEAFDHDLFRDVASLRAALRHSLAPWHRRHRGALVVAALAAISIAAPLAHAAWTRRAPLDYVIKDDLDARVAQMHDLARRAAVVPHDAGPDLTGDWLEPGAPAARVHPVGDATDGAWWFDRGTESLAPGNPGYWRHAGTLTLRALDGRSFLTGTLDRSLGDPDAFVEVELELVDDDTLRLRSAVFHDPGAGFNFAYFRGTFSRIGADTRNASQ